MPTYNRADVLSIGIKGLRREVEPFGEQVEVVISNNHSTDATRQVLDLHADWMQLRVVEPPSHFSGHQHLVWVGQNAGQGEFCWIMGDDDMILPGGLGRVLEMLQKNPSIDYLLPNYSAEPITTRDNLILSGANVYTPPAESVISRCGKTCVFSSIAAFLESGNCSVSYFYTAIVGHVFRRSLWRDDSVEAIVQGGVKGFVGLETTFPHLMILLSAMKTKPVSYIAEPCMLLGLGTQEWSGSWPYIIAFRCRDLIDCYQIAGVRPSYLDLLGQLWLREMDEILLNNPRWIFTVRPIRGRLELLQRVVITFFKRCYSKLPEGFKAFYRRIRKQGIATALSF